MKQKKKYNSINIACQIDREREIATYGKMISLRPSQLHNSKKKYSRVENKKLEKFYE